MNQHLSSEQISRYLAGDATLEEAVHARKCTVCSSQVARLSSPLSLFRSAVRDWSDNVNVIPGTAAPYAAVGDTDSHLDRLLAPATLDVPWYRSLAQGIRELFCPERLPPLDVTSQPIPVKNIWGLYGRQKKSWMFSTGFQVCVVALLFALGTNKAVQQAAKDVTQIFAPVEIARHCAPLRGSCPSLRSGSLPHRWKCRRICGRSWRWSRRSSRRPMFHYRK